MNSGEFGLAYVKENPTFPRFIPGKAKKPCNGAPQCGWNALQTSNLRTTGIKRVLIVLAGSNSLIPAGARTASDSLLQAKGRMRRSKTHMSIHDEQIMHNVLTIEGSEQVAKNFVRPLMEGGFSVEVAHTGRAGVNRLMAHPYDAVVIERRLPDLDGLAVVAILRGIGMQIPVLMMSASADTGQRIEGLRAGVDDYLCMPFSSEEILVRMEVLLRRRSSPPPTSTVLRIAELELDLVQRKMAHLESVEPLQPTEFRLLEFMMRHTGQILTRTMILEAVWGIHFDTHTNLVDVHVGKLRRKVAALGARPVIRTIRGSGYRFG